MSLGISERERATPRTTEDLPRRDFQMRAQTFDVLNEMPGCILFEACVRSALPGTALIEKHDAIDLGIEIATVVRRDAATRSAMKKHHRLTRRIANLFVIKFVNRQHPQPAGVVGFDLRI